MKLMTYPLASLLSLVVWAVPVRAQSGPPLPADLPAAEASDTISPPMNLNGDGCTSGCSSGECAAGCAEDGCSEGCSADGNGCCRAGCGVFHKLVFDIGRAIRTLFVGRDPCCSACGCCACAASCCADTALAEQGEGTIEVVPRELWPAEYHEVPLPAGSTTRAIMARQRDAFAHNVPPGPTLAFGVDRQRAGGHGMPAHPITRSAGTDRPRDGFTAIVTDLTN